VVNALADRLELEIWRDGEVWSSPTKRQAEGQDQGTGKTRKTGTKIYFPSRSIDLRKPQIQLRHSGATLRELAFLKQGPEITLTDERSDKSAEFRFTAASPEFVST